MNKILSEIKALFKGENFSSGRWEDGEFMDDVRQATLRGSHPFANAMFWAIILFVVIAIAWAAFFEIDEVTAGEGKVIPSSNVQILQNQEGGIVSGILVREGDIVELGEVLIQIENSEFSSSLEEKQSRLFNLKAEISRLTAESSNSENIIFTDDVKEGAKHLVTQQEALRTARQREFDQAIGVIKQQILQQQQEIKTLKNKKAQMSRSYELSKQELKMTRPLLAEGVVSEVEILRLERDVNEALGERDSAISEVPKASFLLKELNSRLNEAVAKRQSLVLEELNEKRDELARLEKISQSDEDRVARASVRSPVRATVKRVLVNTIGGVIQPGMDLVELIPIEDSLLIEAKIRPKDIAFLRPNQKAKVKITAYDFTVFGGLEAELEYIGIDTVVDEKDEAFYHIRVRTDKNYLGTEANPLPIIPGMVASVDILTGKKTILAYLLKPFNKMRENALRER